MPTERRKVESDLREAVYDMRRHPLIKAEAVLGLDPDLMLKATMVTTEDDAVNLFNWLANFTPYAKNWRQTYEKSPRLPIPDILVVGYNHWTTTDSYYHNEGGCQLALVDEDANVIFNLGMRYFGERKKGTLTLAWTSGMRLAHGRLPRRHQGDRLLGLRRRPKRPGPRANAPSPFSASPAPESRRTPMPMTTAAPCRQGLFQGRAPRRRLPDRLPGQGLPGLGTHAVRQNRFPAAWAIRTGAT